MGQLAGGDSGTASGCPRPGSSRGLRLWGNWVQGPRGCSVRSLKPRSGKRVQGWWIHVADIIHTLSQPGNPLLSSPSAPRNFQLRLARCPAVAERPGSWGESPSFPHHLPSPPGLGTLLENRSPVGLSVHTSVRTRGTNNTSEVALPKY